MFSRKEIKDLFISVLVLSLAFSSFNLGALPVTIFIVMAVFISHELSHKFLAQHYGFEAEYRMWTFGILLGLISALLPGGIMFAAPGAVYITPYKRKFAFRVARLSRRQHGLINLVGPLTNIVIGMGMILTSFFFPLELFALTARVSFFLALSKHTPRFSCMVFKKFQYFNTLPSE